MKVAYWIFPHATDKKSIMGPREEDGRVLVDENFIDFLVREIYGDINEYGRQQRIQIFVTLAQYEILADEGILTVEHLRKILKTAYEIRHPHAHEIPDYSTVEKFMH